MRLYTQKGEQQEKNRKTTIRQIKQLLHRMPLPMTTTSHEHGTG